MALPFPNFNAQGLTPLERVISTTTVGGTINYSPYDPPVIKAPLKSVADAVKSAYILTAKTDLPKVTPGEFGGASVNGLVGVVAYQATTAESARKRANAWIAVALHLQAKEAAKAYEESKAKAVADAAAKAAKQARLDDISRLHFGRDFADLGPNKISAVNEIHRLETQLASQEEPAA